MWRQRNLTVYGKAIIVRSLAISKLCYVLSPPLHYVKQVKDEIANFIWNGKKPKIKYTTLINDYDQGGIRLPDLDTMIQANRVRWALKIRNSENNVYWKLVCAKIFEQIGGLQFLDENLEQEALLVQIKHIPKFYKEIIHAWSEVSKIRLTNKDDILRQPIWFNRLIKVNAENASIKRLAMKGVKTVHQVWVGKKPSWEKAKEQGWSHVDYLLWRAFVNAIPKEWIVKLRQQNDLGRDRLNTRQQITYVGNEDESYSVEKVNTG